MTSIFQIYKTSVGKKFLVGLTGLFLCTYLVVHVGGNLLLFKNDGGAMFNMYAEFMSANPIIRTIEVVLFIAFGLHIGIGTFIWLRNRAARPQKYDVNDQSKVSVLSSRIAFLSGSIVFIFLMVHLNSFWVPSRIGPIMGNEPVKSMYALVQARFANSVYDWFYVLAMVLLAYHLHHGFESAFQTFGLHNKKYTPLIKGVGVIFWLVIPALFAAMPLFFLWK